MKKLYPSPRRKVLAILQGCVLLVILLYGSLLSAQSTVNVALGKAATASSTQGVNTANRAFDGNEIDTRWESIQGVDPQWIYVDLGSAQNIGRVKLIWEPAYGKDYQIQTSTDASTWETIRTVTGNTALVNDLYDLDGYGRYVRMYGTARGSDFGYSLFEFEVYAPDGSPSVILTAPTAGAVYPRGTAIPLSADAEARDGKTITGVDFYSDGTLLGSATAAPFTYTWTTPPAGTHSLTARATDSEGLMTSSPPVAATVSAVNLALGRRAVASTNSATAVATFDGDAGTRWESVHNVDPQWIYVDLGDEYTIDGVKLLWETAYATDFRIDVSNDAVDWTTVATASNATGQGNNLTNNINNLTAFGRYVRMFGTSRATIYGYSLYEFEVYGLQGTQVITSPEAGATYTAPAAVNISIDGTTAGENITRIELLQGNTVVNTRTVAPFTYEVSLTDLAAGDYNFRTRVYQPNGSVTNSSIVPVYVVPATTGAYSCGEAVTLSAAGAPQGGSYQWYRVPIGGTPIADQTGPEYTTPPIDYTMTYYVSAVDAEGHQSQRAPVTANSNSLARMATDGLTSAYPFRGNANDATGKGNTGIVEGAVLAVDRFGRANSAYSFDGVDDYITTTTSFPTNIEGTNVFSLSLWFNTTTTTGGKMLGLGTARTGLSGQYDRHLYMNDRGQVVFGIYLDTHRTIKTADAFNDGTWHNAVAVLAPGGIKLYIDGTLQVEDPSVTEGEKYAEPGFWRIGYDNLSGWPEQPTSAHFAGLLDDINIYYSTELTPGDLTSLYGASVEPINEGETLRLQATYVEGVSYAWSGPAGFTSTEQNPEIPNATTEDAGEYVVTVSNGTCTSAPLAVQALVNSQASLPIDFLDLRATPAQDGVRLWWVTAREIDNRGFEVQRSGDGFNFRTLHFVDGAGNSEASRSYDYIDTPPATGTVYYRIRQIDFDGSVGTYSQVIPFTLAAGDALTLYPNPARSETKLQWRGTASQEVLLVLTNAEGQIVHTEQLRETAYNTHYLNLSRFAPGLYLLTLRRGGSPIYQARIIRQ